MVLVVSKISATRGTLYIYSGYDLQFPDITSEVEFRVFSGNPPALQFQATWLSDSPWVYTFTHDQASRKMVGWAQDPSSDSKTGPYELARDRNFYVYKDYPAYLESLRIYSKEYQDHKLSQYGKGYLLYLPEGYETDTQKAWPLIYFLHGMGEVGENVYVVAKTSPFMFILNHGPLPAIIVAPQAKNDSLETAFPEAYMDGVLKEVQSIYRIDPKRIYLTGLSLGGWSTWRFALYRPDTFAAIAPLSAFLNDADPTRMKAIQSVPVWAIHGAEDTVVPLANGQQVVDALRDAGGNVKFTVLQDHGHDTWTDIYSDPAFYDWLFQYTRQ
jgi:predicted peptidase